MRALYGGGVDIILEPIGNYIAQVGTHLRILNVHVCDRRSAIIEKFARRLIANVDFPCLSVRAGDRVVFHFGSPFLALPADVAKRFKHFTDILIQHGRSRVNVKIHILLILFFLAIRYKPFGMFTRSQISTDTGQSNRSAS